MTRSLRGPITLDRTRAAVLGQIRARIHALTHVRTIAPILAPIPAAIAARTPLVTSASGTSARLSMRVTTA